MKKSIKTIATSTIALATFAGVSFQSSVVQAEEGTPEETVKPAVSENKDKEITQAEVDSAEKAKNEAKTNVDDKQNAVKAAEEAETNKQNDVDAAQAAITRAEHKDEELPKIEKTIEEETAKKEQAEKELEQAQQDVSAANTNKEEAQTALDNAKKEQEDAQTALAEAEKQPSAGAEENAQKIKAKEQEKATTEQERNKTQADLTAKNQEIAAKQREIDNATDTKQEEKDSNNWKGYYDGLREKNPVMEKIAYDGQKTETVVVEEGKAYTPNIQKIMEYAANYINELKRINGLKGQVTVSKNPKYQDFANYHADEVANKGKFHQTDYPGGRPSELVYENVTQMAMLNDKYLSDQEVAYRAVLIWFSEYTNVGHNYGHAKNILSANGEFVMGIALDKAEKRFTRYGVSFDGVSQTSDLSALQEVGSQSTGLKLRFNGKQLKFLPDTTFRYVTETKVASDTTALREELATLKEEAKQLSTTLENQNKKVTDLQGELTKLQAEKKELDAKDPVKVAARKRVEDAKRDVITKTNAVKTAQEGVDNAQHRVNDLNKKIGDATKALEKANKEKEDLSVDPQVLQDRLTHAQEELNTAKQNKEQAQKELADAKEELKKAEDEYNRISNLYHLQKEIKLRENGKGINGVPNTFPTVDALPTLDINRLTRPNFSPTVKPDENSDAALESKSEKVYNKEPLTRATFANKRLPHTGTSASHTLLAGVLSLFGAGIVARRRKEK
ncbi:LPXTG cell wall anchor domain-containing protein [Carnobacteriaceae bacterium zg-84]|uniref:LPXTG cell wall anchor domain-containing protein n=1 Tax=Granulicatella sp. zg-84 TaxID=2678503 RepID=UPI0013C1756A|nr:LPXTG cell wall anchor domain-containing protein [Granulicatella sp. zg-84]NEW66707.1 LPXTG cell wall anchor domain-containing protein [Granulicatella sp. zg-84]QMI86002.1 LPXTG cell wall anchor domain-containing protein [Carnobacteriaceae bacterium zg-84]